MCVAYRKIGDDGFWVASHDATKLAFVLVQGCMDRGEGYTGKCRAHFFSST